MPGFSLEAVVQEFFTGSEKSIVLNTVLGGASSGLSGKSVARILRNQGIKFANEKFNKIWRSARIQTNPADFFKHVSNNRVIGAQYATQQYEHQAYNYLYQTKVSAAFNEFPQPFEFHITVAENRPLTKAEIYQRVRESLTNRTLGPGSDYGTLRFINSITLDQALIGPGINQL